MPEIFTGPMLSPCFVYVTTSCIVQPAAAGNGNPLYTAFLGGTLMLYHIFWPPVLYRAAIGRDALEVHFSGAGLRS